ncbi:MAG: hypothetical protein JXR04_06135 [Bermanella sp.]
MYSVFGIEPESVNNWHDLRHITEKFGFSKGLLIGQYPKKWMKMVIDSSKENGVGDIELAKIIEKLQQIKDDRFYKTGLPFSPDKEWIDNIEGDGVIDNFNSVITKDRNFPPKFYQSDNIEENVFEDHRETQVERKASCLAGLSSKLLLMSKTLILIDPYFQPKRKCTSVIDEFLKIKHESGIDFEKIEVFTSYSNYAVSDEQYIEDYIKETKLDFDFLVEIIRLDNDLLDFDFHARYLLTDVGGIRYDRGFVEPLDHAKRDTKTDVACLTNHMYKELVAKYDKDKIERVDSIKINSNEST